MKRFGLLLMLLSVVLLVAGCTEPVQDDTADPDTPTNETPDVDPVGVTLPTDPEPEPPVAEPPTDPFTAGDATPDPLDEPTVEPTVEPPTPDDPSAGAPPDLPGLPPADTPEVEPPAAIPPPVIDPPKTE